MQFKSQIVVLGAKASKGEFNGRPFDSTTVYYQADLQDGENFAGQVLLNHLGDGKLCCVLFV